MSVYAIDDEKIALYELCETIQQALPQVQIERFTDPEAALQKLRESCVRPDIVFSDIRMPGMDGLELAVRVKTHSPDTKVIFVTGYSQYAMDAFRAHANGYLMKPVTPEQITEEIAFLGLPVKNDAEKLQVRCFGSFEVFYRSEPLIFKRRLSKELFAFLIDRNGAYCSSEEISAVLWEDEPDLTKLKHRLRNLVSDMRAALKAVGQESVLLRGSGRIAVRRDAVDCDYFRMLDGDMNAVNAFRGEYMSQYSWAQLTEGKLHFMQK